MSIIFCPILAVKWHKLGDKYPQTSQIELWFFTSASNMVLPTQKSTHKKWWNQMLLAKYDDAYTQQWKIILCNLFWNTVIQNRHKVHSLSGKNTIINCFALCLGTNHRMNAQTFFKTWFFVFLLKWPTSLIFFHLCMHELFMWTGCTLSYKSAHEPLCEVIWYNYSLILKIMNIL